VSTAAPRARELGWALIGALAVGIAVALWRSDAPAWPALADWQLRAAAADAPPSGVLVFDIDEATLAELRPRLGAWPYKRDVYALAIEQLRDLGASAIAIDLLLADAHEGDAALARAIARSGAPVVLAAAGLRHESDAASASGSATRWAAMTLPAESLWPAKNQPPRWVGVITTPLDADGRLRHLPLHHSALGRDWPAFPLAVLQATGAASAPAWPLDARGRVTVPFPIEARHEAPTLPFARLARAALGGPPDAELAAAVKGRVVFIGSSAQLADNVLTPGGQWRGTAVLAHAYAALRDGRLARTAPAWTAALLVALGALPVALAWWRRATRPSREALLTLALALAVVAVAYAAASTRLELIALAPALATLAAGFAFGLAAHLRVTARHERELAYESALAEAANRAKSEFLANVSHEIRTPMNAVMGVADLLAHSPLDGQQRRHVEVLQQSGRALLELIDDLLDLAKIEAGRMDVDRTPFALRPMLDALVALLGPRAQGKGLALVLDIADDVPGAALGDRRRVSQALTNLLGNAIKFTAQGEVRLAVTRAAPGEDERIVFAVSDTGIGIAASKLGTIFEPFMQADGSVTRQFGGTGLGLAITRRLVERMGGTIDATSTPGQGSRFTVTLPLPPVALGEVTMPVGLRRAELADALVADALPSRRLSVLLAEDNPTNVYLFEAMLTGIDLVIDVADNGHRAVERFTRQPYDIVFLDVQMPVLDGHEAARAMRRFEAEQGRARTPIVALTAHAYAQDERASLAAGCDAHLTKPIERATLIATLARLAGAAPALPLPSAAPSHTTAAIDVIDEQVAIERLGGNRTLYARACEHAGVFLSTWNSAYDQALRNGDADHARRLAHDLKSISATIGAQSLSDAARELESAFDMPPAISGALDAPAQRVRDALGAALQSLDRRRAA